jgi:chaperonin GroES
MDSGAFVATLRLGCRRSTTSTADADPGTRDPRQPDPGPRVSAGGSSKESAMKIRPLQDRVIVKRVAEEEKTKGGIIIPDTAKEKPIEGKVIAVGNGKVLEGGKVRSLDVKAGDRILFTKYAGTEVKLDGEEHLIIREEDILGVVEGK